MSAGVTTGRVEIERENTKLISLRGKRLYLIAIRETLVAGDDSRVERR
jgi:hypothetical protein